MKRVLEIALAEVGYVEKNTPEQLDDKLQNAGSANYTKYARDMDALLGFYRGGKQGYPWCDVFVDWCFVQAYGRHLARKLLFQPLLSRGAGCSYSMEYFQKADAFFPEPQVGDQIFFRVNERIVHTGLVVSVEADFVETVEGNTSSDAGVVANGGCVRRKRYSRSDAVIAGFGRPDYTLVNT